MTKEDHAMSVELRVPSAGESVSEVEIGQWHKSVGDRVEEDEIVVELETDKANFDLPAPVSGTLEKILKKEGEATAPGEVIGYISPRSETAAGDTDGKAAEEETAEEETAEEETAEEETAEEESAEEESAEEELAEEESAEEESAEEETVEPRPSSRDERVGKAIEEQGQVMPSARRLMAEHGLGPADVRGTGPGGRVLKEDVLRHLDGKTAKRARGEPAPGVGERRQEEAVRMTLIRRRIAERLVEAQQSAALLTTFNEADMSEVIALRREHAAIFQETHEVKLGFMSFFVKATVDALKRFPVLNARVRGEEILYRNYYDIGIAVASERGLVVPVLRDADRMSFAEIEQTVSEFARKARDNDLEVEDLQGGTFSITNGGVFGSLLSTPIVNPPQSGILGLHAIQDRPVARDGEVIVRPMMYVALSYDHRIVDGREAVLFLRRIKECIEAPARMILET